MTHPLTVSVLDQHIVKIRNCTQRSTRGRDRKYFWRNKSYFEQVIARLLIEGVLIVTNNSRQDGALNGSVGL
jgi:hypothetical protein